jgi:hypothetical protein
MLMEIPQILEVLNDLGTYRTGDIVGTMKSEWLDTKSRRKRWKGRDYCKLTGTEEANTSHFIDLSNETELIYQEAFSLGNSGHSKCFLVRKLDDKWSVVKILQQLIR